MNTIGEMILSLFAALVSEEEFDEAVRMLVEPKMKEAEEVWNDLEDVPMDPETECIEVEWRGFPAGTHREEIWHWIEQEYNVRVYDLLYGKGRNSDE